MRAAKRVSSIPCPTIHARAGLGRNRAAGSRKGDHRAGVPLPLRPRGRSSTPRNTRCPVWTPSRRIGCTSSRFACLLSGCAQRIEHLPYIAARWLTRSAHAFRSAAIASSYVIDGLRAFRPSCPGNIKRHTSATTPWCPSLRRACISRWTYFPPLPHTTLPHVQCMPCFVCARRIASRLDSSTSSPVLRLHRGCAHSRAVVPHLGTPFPQSGSTFSGSSKVSRYASSSFWNALFSSLMVASSPSQQLPPRSI